MTRWAGRFVLALLASAIGLGLAELVARQIEPEPYDQIAYVRDTRLGWLPSEGRGESVSAEFHARYTINALGMNDAAVDDTQLGASNRILAVGDSHTFAIGVSQPDAWPARLERDLFARAADGTVWNAAVKGYSLDQYLVRFRGLRERVRPTLVLVGLSMATDLWDLGPPGRDGFTYGGRTGRVYFDLDESGQLVEHDELADDDHPATVRPGNDPSTFPKPTLRDRLQEFALYRLAKQSRLALFIATHYRPNGTSLWPGTEALLARELDPPAARRWKLAEQILARMHDEARAAGAELAVVAIPYLPQVYDSIWQASFGSVPGYDRYIGNRRLAALCARHGIALVDTTPAFVRAQHATGRSLHFRVDRHPTPEGHALIAREVAGFLRAQPGLLR